MPRQRCLFALLAVLLTALTGCGGARSSETAPGISDSEIVIGSSYPFSGSVSAYGAVGYGAAAYFSHLNETAGGVRMADGKLRKIKFVTHDNAYDPARALSTTQELVEKDQVFAVFHPFGSTPNFAIREYLNEAQVPHIFLGSGLGLFGAEREEFPWSIGWQLPGAAEVGFFADLLKTDLPKARVAVLLLNNDAAKEMLRAFENAIQGSQIEVVRVESTEPTDPTVDAQVSNLARTNADVLLNLSTNKGASQTIRRAHELGWRLKYHFLNAAISSVEGSITPAGVENPEGLYTLQYLKDPSDDKDPAIAAYKEVLAEYAPRNVDPNDLLPLQGYSAAQSLVKALEQSDPTRESLMDAARNLNSVAIDGLLAGVTLNTSEDDPFPIESAQLAHFEDGRWLLQGELISFEGKTLSLLEGAS